MKTKTTMKKLIPILTLCALPMLGVAQNTVLINFTDNSGDSVGSFPIGQDGSGNYWNNAEVADYPSDSINGNPGPTLALVNTADTPLTWTLAVTNLPGGNNYGFNCAANGSWEAYTGPYPSALSSFPQTALESGMSALGGSGGSVTISGLNPANTYNVLVYGGSSASAPPNGYGSGGYQTDTLTDGTSASPTAVHYNSLNNATTVVTWNNVTPDANGEIAFTVVPDASNGGGDVNMIQIVEASGTQPPAAPASLSAAPGNGKVTLIWAASPGASTYNVERSTTSMGETPLITGVTGTTYSDTTAVNGTTYYYEVQAVNANGPSGNSPEASATPNATITALVNFTDNNGDSVGSFPIGTDGSGNYWNNAEVSDYPSDTINGSSGSLALVDTLNGNDGWTLQVVDLPGGNNYGYNCNANGSWEAYTGPYPSALSSFPQTALESGMSAVGGSGGSVTLSGLDPTSTYNVVVYGASTAYAPPTGYGSGGYQTDTLTIGSTTSPLSVDYDSYGNATTVVTWNNVTPSAGGQIAFTVVPDASNPTPGGDVNFLEVTQVGASAPSPASITSTLSGNMLNLTWPSGQGWRLVSQTNDLSAGLNETGTWTTVGGASDGSYSVTLDPTQPSVFYELVNP
jgi:hypothetical protein